MSRGTNSASYAKLFRVWFGGCVDTAYHNSVCFRLAFPERNARASKVEKKLWD